MNWVAAIFLKVEDIFLLEMVKKNHTNNIMQKRQLMKNNLTVTEGT